MKYLLFNICFLLIFSSCALTLISPGINSNHRIEDKSFIKMEDSAFYGTFFYRYFSYFIIEENYFEVINDPNNTFDVTKLENFHLKHGKNKILILYEFCYDKTKSIDWEKDLPNYIFSLNDIPPEHQLQYEYPYSFKKVGLKYKLERPLSINRKYPHHNEIEETGDDYISCMRNLLSFSKEAQYENSNNFKVTTPRKNSQHFEYLMKNGVFQLYEKEEFHINGFLIRIR